MKIEDLTQEQLKLLAAFKDTETFKILSQLALGIKNSHSSMMVAEVEVAKDQFEALKSVLKRTYLAQGMLDLLKMSELCQKVLDKKAI